MIPKPQQTLTDLAVRIATHIMPNSTSEFAAADSGLISGLLLTAAQEFERAVECRMQDINDLKNLFGNYSGVLPGHIAWQPLMEQQPESLHLRDVTHLHGEFLKVFVAIHAWSEEAGQAGVERAAWAFLRRHTERHKYEGVAV